MRYFFYVRIAIAQEKFDVKKKEAETFKSRATRLLRIFIS